MATYYSNVYIGPTSKADDSEGTVINLVGKLTYPAGVAPATGDVLKFARLPANCYVTKVRLFYPSWGTTVPVKIGTSTTDDDAVVAALALQTSVATTGKTYLNDETGGTSTNSAAFATDLPVLTAAEDFQGTLGSVTAGTAGSAITFQIEYIHLAAPTAGTVAYNWNSTSSGRGVAST